MNRILTLLAAGIVFMAGCRDVAGPTASDDRIVGPIVQNIDEVVKQREADLSFLANELSTKHANAFFQRSREDFERDVERLRKVLPSLNDQELHVEWMKLAASLGDAHALILPPQKRLYPFQLYAFTDGFYVLAAPSEHSDWIGLKVTAINGHDIKQVLTSLQKIIPHENEYWFQSRAPSFLVDGDILYGLHFANDPERAVFTLEEANGKLRHVDLKALSADELSRTSITTGFTLGEAPLFLRNPAQNYSYTLLPEWNTLYFQYNKCADMKNHTVAETTNDILELLRKSSPDKLIIDLRFNQGGNSRLLDPFIDMLQNEKINREGHLYVLIGRQTFSSGLMNALSLKNKTNALLVGEPTGGKPNSYGEVVSFQLPHSGLWGQYSSRYFMQVADNNQASLYPDVQVNWTIKDYINKTDPVLEYVLRR